MQSEVFKSWLSKYHFVYIGGNIMPTITDVITFVNITDSILQH